MTEVKSRHIVQSCIKSILLNPFIVTKVPIPPTLINNLVEGQCVQINFIALPDNVVESMHRQIPSSLTYNSPGIIGFLSKSR